MHTLPVYGLNFEILEFSAASETHFKRDICGLDHYASEPFNCRMVPKVSIISLFADFPTLLNAYRILIYELDLIPAGLFNLHITISLEGNS